MIVFDLSCDGGHKFEGWFGSSADFADQCARGLVSCPQCGSAKVTKAPMAPAVASKGNLTSRTNTEPALQGGTLPPEVVQAFEKLAQVQAKALKSSEYVGERFADESRAIHYGEREGKAIHGKATLKDARDLLDEGIAVAPIVVPFTPPDDLN